MYSRYDPTGRTVFRPLDDERGGSSDFAPVPDGYSGTAFPRAGSVPLDFSEAHGSSEDAGAFPGGESAVSAERPDPDGGADPSGGPSAPEAPPPAASASAPVSATDEAKRGILSSLRSLFGGLRGSLDLGDIILLLIVALLFLEDGDTGDLIILAGVALFLGL